MMRIGSPGSPSRIKKHTFDRIGRIYEGLTQRSGVDVGHSEGDWVSFGKLTGDI